VTRPWGLWRYSPSPRKWLGDIQLPWSYLDAEPLNGAYIELVAPGAPERRRGYAMQVATSHPILRAGLDILERELRRANIPTDGHVRDVPLGAMRTLRISITRHEGRIPGGRRSRESLYWLVPPLLRFADLDKHFEAAEVSNVVGPGQFYVNPEIYEAAAEFVQGDIFGSHHVINARDLIYAADLGTGDARVDEAADEMRQFVSAALDSFLELRAPDPRFNPRVKRTNPPRTPAEAESVFRTFVQSPDPEALAVALDVAEEAEMTLADLSQRWARENWDTRLHTRTRDPDDIDVDIGIFILSDTDKDYTAVQWTVMTRSRQRALDTLDIEGFFHGEPFHYEIDRRYTNRADAVDRAVTDAWFVVHVMRRRWRQNKVKVCTIIRAGGRGEYDEETLAAGFQLPPNLLRHSAGAGLRANAAATVDDIIQIAMDTVEEKKPNWDGRALEILSQIGGSEYLGRRTARSRIAVAQCIRPLEGPEGTRQALYRLWGQTKLADQKRRYVVVSTSKRWRTWGETAIFPSNEHATELAEEEAAWPAAIAGKQEPFGGFANYSVDSHREALQEIGITHVIPCGAVVMNPAGGTGFATPRGSAADRIRAAVAARTERCDDQCPGWAVFDVNREPGIEIQACDECNQLARQFEQPTFTDEEFAALPEAQRELDAGG
jgi:hypothetical protein